MGNRYDSVIHAWLRNNCGSINNDLFRNHVRDNPLCEWCGVMEDATHFCFHCIKYIDERQVFNGTVRDFKPLTNNLILLEAKTGILKQIWSCSGLSADISMPRNVFHKLFDSFFETNFKTNY